MGCCWGRKQAARRRHVPLVEEEAPRPWVTDPWSTERVWQGAPGAFNVLAIYTSDCAYGPDYVNPVPQDELLANIRQSVDEMNEAFQNSGVAVQASLVAIVQLAVPEPWLPCGMYRDALLGPPDDEEHRVLRKQDPMPKELTDHYANLRRICLELRAEHDAHVVFFVMNGSAGGDPGAGALGATSRDDAFVMLPHRKLLDEYTPAHEVGHLFGCEHDRARVAVRMGMSCYGYVTERWRTVMAYNPLNGTGGRVIAHFSNPAVMYQDGQHDPEPTGADNANNVAQINGYTATILGLNG